MGHGVPGGEVFDFVVAEGGVADGPVHVVKVEVGDLKIGESDVDALFDVFGAVAGILLDLLI